MKSTTILSNINQLKIEIENIKNINKNKKDTYIKKLNKIYESYIDIEISENFKTQYNQLNGKGAKLIRELKNNKSIDKITLDRQIEMYIRYLRASLCDFKGETVNLRKYISSFLFCAMFFLVLSPQFYGFVLPMLFFIPMYIGLKGVKRRSVTGFYMTMSVIPVAFITAFTWIRYGFNVIGNTENVITQIVADGVAVWLAEILVYVGPAFGCFLLLFASLQLYRGIRSKNLFI